MERLSASLLNALGPILLLKSIVDSSSILSYLRGAVHPSNLLVLPRLCVDPPLVPSPPSTFLHHPMTHPSFRPFRRGAPAPQKYRQPDTPTIPPSSFVPPMPIRSLTRINCTQVLTRGMTRGSGRFYWTLRTHATLVPATSHSPARTLRRPVSFQVHT
ncbi:hypothetical protein DFH07DRAFT_462012 [Mycena maculata]|uniref:Uncharacterized protein n=1 Tax=Mycena maculata TaxID=230809 RepID=A0AAD7NYE9_9AGAR|nr:hypothetical protein DFH07DRAFT_462012 [Mycena maculata]